MDSVPPDASSSVNPNLEARRSHVRVIVTYGAAGFLFAGGLALIAVALLTQAQNPGFAAAKDLFTAISPIATGVVTYWFASRSVEKNSQNNGK
ncbi:MAG: hypothetical protein OXM87_11920 [Truepera sp.]|nr:hypothetical protein [Truepera sp.]